MFIKWTCFCKENIYFTGRETAKIAATINIFPLLCSSAGVQVLTTTNCGMQRWPWSHWCSSLWQWALLSLWSYTSHILRPASSTRSSWGSTLVYASSSHCWPFHPAFRDVSQHDCSSQHSRRLLSPSVWQIACLISRSVCSGVLRRDAIRDMIRHVERFNFVFVFGFFFITKLSFTHLTRPWGRLTSNWDQQIHPDLFRVVYYRSSSR